MKSACSVAGFILCRMVLLPSGGPFGNQHLFRIYCLPLIYSSYNKTLPTKALDLKSGRALSHYAWRLKPKFLLLWINSVSLTSLLPWHWCLDWKKKKNPVFFYFFFNFSIKSDLHGWSCRKDTPKSLKCFHNRKKHKMLRNKLNSVSPAVK